MRLACVWNAAENLLTGFIVYDTKWQMSFTCGSPSYLAALCTWSFVGSTSSTWRSKYVFKAGHCSTSCSKLSHRVLQCFSTCSGLISSNSVWISAFIPWEAIISKAPGEYIVQTTGYPVQYVSFPGFPVEYQSVSAVNCTQVCCTERYASNKWSLWKAEHKTPLSMQETN